MMEAWLFFRRTFSLLLLAASVPLASAQQALSSKTVPLYGGFGGVHELNFYVAHSWDAGPMLGYVRNTRYTTVVGRYSYQLREYRFGTLRYAPEITLLGNLYEPAPSPHNIHTDVPTRALGAGLSPANLQFVFLPRRRIQPYINADGGFLLYNQPVLSDGGTKFMFTVDIGAGQNIFISRQNAINIGFRYQHQSNADIGQHNPGTDGELWTFGFSHFFTLQSRGK